jgi:hypothetical protein
MALVDAQQAKAIGNVGHAINLSERFLITSTELNSLEPSVAEAPEQQFIFASLLKALCCQPFVVVGWSASEKYLIDRIDSGVRPVLQNPDRQPPLANDELSVIDRVFNPAGHTRLASFYNKNAATTHIDVGQIGFSTDDLFLWLQALYAIGFLKLRATALDESVLKELAEKIEQPPTDRIFVISWVDDFLPVWVRLCWRCGLVAWENENAQRVEIDDLALESRDEHIPWRLSGSSRPELTAASRLLAALYRSTHGEIWDYSKFPGGLYRDLRLVIPIPVWASDPPNDLRGLKPLIDAIKQSGAGYIENLSLVFISANPTDVISDDLKRIWKQLVATCLSMARFANADDIEDIQLEDL